MRTAVSNSKCNAHSSKQQSAELLRRRNGPPQVKTAVKQCAQQCMQLGNDQQMWRILKYSRCAELAAQAAAGCAVARHEQGIEILWVASSTAVLCYAAARRLSSKVLILQFVQSMQHSSCTRMVAQYVRCTMVLMGSPPFWLSLLQRVCTWVARPPVSMRVCVHNIAPADIADDLLSCAAWLVGH